MTRDEALARTDLRGLLDQLGGARGLTSRGKRYPCPDPGHEQTGKSPPVEVARKGACDVWWCPVCDRGGTAIDALVAAGRARDVADALAQLGAVEDRSQDDWTPQAEYAYHDVDGKLLYTVVRFPGKKFRQRRADGAWSMEGVERQLFRLPEVIAARTRGDWIFVCEGEKDALAVTRSGYCGTCNPGGAGKWEPQYTTALRDAKVVIVADDDDAGIKHALMVFQEIYGKATTRVGIRLPHEGCNDVSDHLAAGYSLDGDLRRPREMMDIPPLVGSSRTAFTAAVFASRASQDKSILGPLIQRGMLTVVGAQTGEGKTTLCMQLVRALLEGEPFLDEAWLPRVTGARALLVDLEQGESVIQIRLREAGLDTSERAHIFWEPSGLALDKREEDRGALRDVLRDGHYDAVILDPLYQSHLGSANDDQVAGAVMGYLSAWAREFNTAFVIPMHARKPPAGVPHKFTKYDLAGSSVWLRIVDFVLGLQLRTPGFSQLYFFKDRVGRGPDINSWWGLTFERGTGFQRNHKEDENKLRAAVKELLKGAEGATRGNLLRAAGGNEVLLEGLLKKSYERDGHWRSEPWNVHQGQTAMDT